MTIEYIVFKSYVRSDNKYNKGKTFLRVMGSAEANETLNSCSDTVI